MGPFNLVQLNAKNNATKSNILRNVTYTVFFTQLSIDSTMTHPIFCVPAEIMSFGTISFLNILFSFTKYIR